MGLGVWRQEGAYVLGLQNDYNMVSESGKARHYPPLCVHRTLRVSCLYDLPQVRHDARLNIFDSWFWLAPKFLLRSLPILASHDFRKQVFQKHC